MVSGTGTPTPPPALVSSLPSLLPRSLAGYLLGAVNGHPGATTTPSSVPGKLAHGVCCGGPQCSWRKSLRRLLRNSDPGQGCQTEWGGKEFRKLGNGCCCHAMCQARLGSGRDDDCRLVCHGVRPGIWIPTSSISLCCP